MARINWKKLGYFAYFEFDNEPKYVLEALKNFAELCDCTTKIVNEGYGARLTIGCDENAYRCIEFAHNLALSDKYGYRVLLSRRLYDANIRGAEHYDKWLRDYIFGFFEGITLNKPIPAEYDVLLKHPRILGRVDGCNSLERYERLEAE